jgi:hypothetical protein
MGQFVQILDDPFKWQQDLGDRSGSLNWRHFLGTCRVLGAGSRVETLFAEKIDEAQHSQG